MGYSNEQMGSSRLEPNDLIDRNGKYIQNIKKQKESNEQSFSWLETNAFVHL